VPWACSSRWPILFVLRGAARDIYRRLMDAVDPSLVTDAERVLAGTPGVSAGGAHGVKAQ
jgi:hypothetical protein